MIIQKVNNLLLKNYIKYLLFLIVVIIGFVTRTYYWHFGYNEGVPGLFLHGDGYINMAQDLVSGEFNTAFSHWRSFLQMIYPIYLSPIFLLNIDQSIYVFWLHHFFLISTLFLILQAGKFLQNFYVGLIASFLYSAQLMFAFWFNFTLADTAFHFHLSLFIFISILLWKNKTLNYFILQFLAGIILGFIRPEGLIYYFSILYFSLYIVFDSKISKIKFLIISLAILSFILFTIIYTLVNSKDLRHKIMSNIHVGYSLYLGSLPDFTTAEGVNNKLYGMYDACNPNKQNIDETFENNSSDYSFKKNDAYYCSLKGFNRIKENPLMYTKILLKRIPNVLYPSFYREGVSLKYKLNDRVIMFFITIGVVLYFILFRKNDAKHTALFLSAISVYLFISLMQSEWDVRVQISPQILLLPVASNGWFFLIRKYTKLEMR